MIVNVVKKEVKPNINFVMKSNFAYNKIFQKVESILFNKQIKTNKIEMILK